MQTSEGQSPRKPVLMAFLAGFMIVAVVVAGAYAVIHVNNDAGTNSLATDQYAGE